MGKRKYATKTSPEISKFSKFLLENYATDLMGKRPIKMVLGGSWLPPILTQCREPHFTFAWWQESKQKHIEYNYPPEPPDPNKICFPKSIHKSETALWRSNTKYRENGRKPKIEPIGLLRLFKIWNKYPSPGVVYVFVFLIFFKNI